MNGYYNLDLPGSSTAFHNPTIQAAILSVQHSFRVQNYAYGEDNLGTITINGAIAQKYRGIVGTINTSGYGKNYNYDNAAEVPVAAALPDADRGRVADRHVGGAEGGLQLQRHHDLLRSRPRSG